MPYNDDQIEKLKATDPAIVRQALERLTPEQRADLSDSIKAYNTKKAQPAQQEEGWISRNIGKPLAGLATDIGQGITGVANAMVGEPVVAAAKTLGATDWAAKQEAGFQAARQASEQRAQEGGTVSRVNQMLGAAIPQTAAASLMPGSGLAANTLKAGATVFATTPGSVSDRSTAANVAMATVPVAAGLGKAAGKVLSVGKGAATNLLANTKVGNAIGIKMVQNPEYAGADELLDLFMKEKIRPDTAAITGDPVQIAKSRALARQSPEYSKWLMGQAKEGVAALDAVVSSVQQEAKLAGWQNLDQVRAAAESGGKRSAAAKALLQAVDQSGDDWKQIAQTSGNLKLFLAKMKSDADFDRLNAMDTAIREQKFSAAKALADQANAGAKAGEKSAIRGLSDKLDYDISRTKQAWQSDLQGILDENKTIQAQADQQVAKIKKAESLGRLAPKNAQAKIADINAATEGALKAQTAKMDTINSARGSEIDGLKGAFTKQAEGIRGETKIIKPTMRQVADVPGSAFVRDLKDAISKVDDPLLNKTLARIESGEQDMSFAGLRQLRSEINAHVSQMKGGQAAPSGASIAQAERVAKSLGRHLDEYAAGNGAEFQQAYQTANENFKANVVPYKKANFGKALAADDPTRAAAIFQGSNLYDKQKMWSLLDKKGQAAVKSGLITGAIEKAEKSAPGVVGLDYSPAQTATALRKILKDDTISVISKGDPDFAARIAGMEKIMTSISKSNVGFVPETGATLESFTSPKKLAKPLELASYALNWFGRKQAIDAMTNPKAKGLLVVASKLKEDSPALRDIIYNKLPIALGITAGNSAAGTAEGEK